MSKLVIAIMYSDEKLYEKVMPMLIEKYGAVIESKEYDFDQFTHYYEKEMGKKLVKRFLIFNFDLEKNDLIKIKKETTAIEKEFSKENNRQINLDPGYLNEEGLFLASFKRGTNYKEDLGSGVYNHKVLEFEGKSVKIFWHTFPDYRVKEHQEFFIENIKRAYRDSNPD